MPGISGTNYISDHRAAVKANSDLDILAVGVVFVDLASASSSNRIHGELGNPFHVVVGLVLDDWSE